jgi:hypothetical protein
LYQRHNGMLFLGKSTLSASCLLHGIIYEKFTIMAVTGDFCEPRPVTCEDHVVSTPGITACLKAGISTIRSDYIAMRYSVMGCNCVVR